MSGTVISGCPLSEGKAPVPGCPLTEGKALHINGKYITASRWIALVVPTITGIIGAVIGVMSMLLIAVTEPQMSKAIERQSEIQADATRLGAELALEKWTGHARVHDEVSLRLARIEEKLDRLIQEERRRP